MDIDPAMMAAAAQELAQVEEWAEEYISIARAALGKGHGEITAMGIITVAIEKELTEHGIDVMPPRNLVFMFAFLAVREAKRTMT